MSGDKGCMGGGEGLLPGPGDGGMNRSTGVTYGSDGYTMAGAAGSIACQEAGLCCGIVQFDEGHG